MTAHPYCESAISYIKSHTYITRLSSFVILYSMPIESPYIFSLFFVLRIQAMKEKQGFLRKSAQIRHLSTFIFIFANSHRNSFFSVNENKHKKRITCYIQTCIKTWPATLKPCIGSLCQLLSLKSEIFSNFHRFCLISLIFPTFEPYFGQQIFSGFEPALGRRVSTLVLIQIIVQQCIT